MGTEPVPMPKSKYVHGTRPIHVHMNDDGTQWQCNSPYCIDMHTNSPEFTPPGPVPVIEGQEPWRGRQ